MRRALLSRAAIVQMWGRGRACAIFFSRSRSICSFVCLPFSFCRSSLKVQFFCAPAAVVKILVFSWSCRWSVSWSQCLSQYQPRWVALGLGAWPKPAWCSFNGYFERRACALENCGGDWFFFSLQRVFEMTVKTKARASMIGSPNFTPNHASSLLAGSSTLSQPDAHSSPQEVQRAHLLLLLNFFTPNAA